MRSEPVARPVTNTSQESSGRSPAVVPRPDSSARPSLLLRESRQPRVERLHDIIPAEPAVEPAVAEETPVCKSPPPSYYAAAAVICGLLLLWLYGPTLSQLVSIWTSHPDYMHSFLVIPFAVWLLWRRRTSLPQSGKLPNWGGLALVLISLAMRFVASRGFAPSLAEPSLVLWFAGACWLVAGSRTLVWAVPALVPLAFLCPLPAQLAHLLEGPIQSAVAKMSAALLVVLGRPALVEDRTLFLGETTIDLAGICSGLGTLYGPAAIACAFAALRGRGGIEKLILIIAIAPIGLLAAAIRLAALTVAAAGADGQQDFASGRFGWFGLCIAVGLFALLAAYLRRLLIEVELETAHRMLQRPVTS